MKKYLIILNDAPYGSERTYNGLRLAGSLSKNENVQIKIFLMGDSVSSAKKGQKVPPGYYNIEIMLSGIIRRSGNVAVCGTCVDARAISENELSEGIKRSTLDELTQWTIESDQVLIF